MHKAGFVNIIGLPNAGKSTLMNALVGEKLSIITYKAQTTRHRIMGIVNGKDFQIVYSDTPGIIDPGYKLHNKMMGFVNEAIADADIFILVIDTTSKKNIDDTIIDAVKESSKPIIVVLNKSDVTEDATLLLQAQQWQSKIPTAEIIPVSALKNRNTNKLFELILRKLPEHPAYFDKENITNRTERFFAAEIIREKIFLNYEKEIPYSCEVIIEDYKEEEAINKIRAVILAERDSQKNILIGNKGESIKKLGIEARKELEEFTGKKIFLELFVKVSKDWRNNENQLKRFGYNS